jgi:hypothetical protein
MQRMLTCTSATNDEHQAAAVWHKASNTCALHLSHMTRYNSQMPHAAPLAVLLLQMPNALTKHLFFT